MPPEFGTQLDHAVAEAVGALDELREIARGIHPAVLAAYHVIVEALTNAAKDRVEALGAGTSLRVELPLTASKPVKVNT
jgi:hypothetical protein